MYTIQAKLASKADAAVADITEGPRGEKRQMQETLKKAMRTRGLFRVEKQNIYSHEARGLLKLEWVKDNRHTEGVEFL